MNSAIRVENLGKRYRVNHASGHGGYKTLRESVVGAISAPLRRWRNGGGECEIQDFWALKDVSFEVQPGEVIGIIGRNGAGKSTLLKILSRITKPTTGQVTFRGRIGSLLEVGTGFHPELTGRENIYLNGSILGMTRRDIARRFDEIVAFAEIEKFLDTPVKRYSSGMYVRLAFAVAAHLELEILVIDEVLAVGDAAFQQKCINKMRSVNREGRTVLFVSHQIPAIQNFCDRCVYLRDGRVQLYGPTDDALNAYHKDVSVARGANVDLSKHPGRTSGSIPTMRHVKLVNLDDGTGTVPMGGSVRVEVAFRSTKELTDVTFGLVVKSQAQTPVFGINNLVLPSKPLEKPTCGGQVGCTLHQLPLMPGCYSLDLYFGSQGQNFDIVQDAAELRVSAADVFGSGRLPPASAGSVWWPASWEIVAHDSPDEDA